MARDLLNQGRARAARPILEALQRELAPKSPSRELQFRVRTNLGACAMQLGEFDVANREYASALAHEPNAPKALANAAMAKLVMERPDDALVLTRRARDHEPKDPHVVSVHLRALYEAGRGAEIEALLHAEPWIQEHVGCALALAYIRCQQTRYEDAERLARDALRGSPADAQPYLLLARAILTPVQQLLHGDPPFSWRVPETLRARLVDAETALGSAVDLLDQQDSRPLLHDALVNRAAARAMLGHFEDALRDCDRVLAHAQANVRALRNKALLLLHLDRRREAIQILEGLPLDSEVDLVLASAYVDEGLPEKAIELLVPRFHPGTPDERQLEIADALLAAYGRSGMEVEANALVRSILEAWPNDADALLGIARHRRLVGNNEEAIALLREALAYGVGHGRDRIALELAETYNAASRYSEAAELYGLVVDQTVDHPLTRKYLVALYNAGSYRDALVLARTLRGEKAAVPVVTEVEALVMERIGDLEGAIDLRTRLAEIEQRSVSHRVRIALLKLRRGNREGARETLASIRVRELSDSQALLQVAQARDMLGMAGALPFAYRARRLDFGNADVHLGYIGVFLNREDPDRELLEAERVAVDCTVHLRSGDVVQTFTILDDQELNRERGELLPSDPLARKLLGLAKGTQVALKQGPLEELSYEIVDVQSKYVSAFQETLTKFSTWFPEHSGFHRIQIPEGDISKALMVVDARHRYTNQIAALYREKHLTLGACARLAGVPMIHVWAGFINRPDGGILASNGRQEDMDQEASLLSGTKEVVLEFTALLTLGFLGLLDRLPQRFDRLLVPQALLDELDQTLVERFAGLGRAMTVWKEGEQYVRHESTPEELEGGRAFLERIRTFVHSKCAVTPTKAALDIGRARLNELEELLGRAAVGAMLLASEHASPLYTDDLGLREIARNEWQARGFWTQTLLMDFRTSGAISEDEYCQAVEKLVLANYRFVAISADGLLWTLRAAGFGRSTVASRVLETFHGPGCSEESAVSVLSDLLKRLWLEPLLYHQKLLLLDLILESLTTGRHRDRTLKRFALALRERFALAPTVLRPILQGIDVWRQQKTLEGGLIRLE